MPNALQASLHPILVIADDREPECVIQALRLLPDIHVEVSRLKLGDYKVDGRLLVERKSLRDFALSVLDGRLFSQAGRLAGSAIPSVLILEGTGADLGASGIRREALQGALVQEIPGIGPETAKTIRWAVSEAAAEFGE